MAKIGYGNWNELPWRPIPTKFVDGECKTFQVIFGMECKNMVCSIGKCLNGMPVGNHTHPHEQIAFILQGEVDYVIDGIPYRLTRGGFINVPPHYEHYSHVYRSKEPLIQIEVFTPYRESSVTTYKQFLKENGIDWDATHVREVPDLTAPLDPNQEVRA